MQFIPEGPNIPEALLNAHADGDVVFFCGAGVSVDAGYPLFDGLVKELRSELPISDTTELDLAIKDNQFDYALYIIEQKLKGDGHVYRRKVAEILSRPPIKLDVHETILALSKNSSGECRLVTTNFDRLFIQAAGPNHDLMVDAYPKLPIAKKTRWQGIVHLHGLLPEHEPSKEDLYNMVLSSADFGEAYVTDSYCSQFIVELLRNFTVVFVGYSINDPVMRYLLDAISVAQIRDRSDFKKPYVFVPAKEKDQDRIERAWRLRPVEAIPYLIKQRHRHFRLYETLAEWVKLSVGGQRARKTLALTEAQKRYMEEDSFAKQRLLWALDDDRGETANALAEADPTAPIEWLPTFAKHGLLDRVFSRAEFLEEIKRQQGSGKKSEESNTGPPEYKNSITRGKIGYALKPVTENLLKWMQHHINNFDCADWFIRHGGVPHPTFSDLYRRGLRTRTVKPEQTTRRFWDLITSDAYRLSHDGSFYWFDLAETLDFTNGAHRLELLSSIELHLKIKPLLMPREAKFADFIDQFDYELEYRNPHLDYQIRKIVEHVEDHKGIELVASDVTGVIERGLHWLQLVKRASDESDVSSYWIASISKHSQDAHPNDFALLVFLLREAFDRLLAADRRAGIGLAQYWRSKAYPLFKRLFLYAGVAIGADFDAEISELLQQNNGRWLWSPYVKREVNRYLRLRVKHWPKSRIERLFNKILTGPERGEYREMSDEDWEAFRSRLICRYLLKLSQGGVALPEKAKDRLKKCEIILPEDHSDEFLIFTGEARTVTWGDDIAADEHRRFVEAEPKDRLDMLERGELKTTAHIRKLAADSPLDSLAMLESAIDHGDMSAALWSESFYGLSDFFEAQRRSRKDDEAARQEADKQQEHLLESVAGRFFDLLATIPQEILQEPSTASALGYCWRNSPTKTIQEDEYLRHWDRLWALFSPMQKMERQEAALNFAINTPSGQMMEQLFSRLWPTNAKVGMGVPQALSSRIEKAVRANDHQVADASSIIITSRLGVLHLLDQDWTQDTILFLLNWRMTPSAAVYWSAFLWNGRFNPDLFTAFQDDFMEALRKEEKLDDSAYENLCQMFALASLEAYGMSAEIIRNTLAGLSESALRFVTDFIRHQLLNSKDAAAARWENAIKPWFNKYWPRDRGNNDPPIIENFAMTALYAGDAFPDALAWFEKNGLLGESPGASTIIFALEKKDNGGHEDFENTHTLIERFPDAVLRLLWIVRPFQWDHGQAGILLQRISAQDATLADTPEYRNLAAALDL